MIYSKQPIDIPKQVSILKARGLVIEDENIAFKYFSSISYFHLASYWKPFEIDSTSHQLVKGTSLNEILSLHSFDCKLRNIIFSALQDIEIALRARIIHSFSLTHGAFWFMDKTLFSDSDIFVKCLTSLQNEVSRSKEDFIQDHYKKYDLESWIRCLTVLRNCCAHHARIWNRRFPWKPQLPQKLPLNWIDSDHILPMKLFAILSVILYLEQSIVSSFPVKERLANLLLNQSRFRLKSMGFPENWLEQQLWN